MLHESSRQSYRLADAARGARQCAAPAIETVRRTKVELDDTTDMTGAAGSIGVTGTNPPSTAASCTVDNTFGASISDANPNKG